MQKVLEEQQNERPITTTSVFSLLPFLLTLRNIRHYELSACRKSCAEILCSRLKYIYDTYVARPSIKVGRLHRGCGGGPYGAETYGPPLRKRRAVFYGFERKCSLGFIGNSNFFFFSYVRLTGCTSAFLIKLFSYLRSPLLWRAEHLRSEKGCLRCIYDILYYCTSRARWFTQNGIFKCTICGAALAGTNVQ